MFSALRKSKPWFRQLARKSRTNATTTHAFLAVAGREPRAIDLSHDPPLAHHGHAVREADELGQFRTDHDARKSLRREVGDDAVDLGLRADIDAAGRLVDDEDARLRLEPARERELLLVAARQRRDRRRRPRAADGERVDPPTRHGALARLVDARAAEPGVAVERRQRHVRDRRERDMQPAPLAVLAHIGDTRAHRVLRAAERARAAVDEHRSGRGPQPENRLRRLGASGADEARETDDLAGAHGEVDSCAPPDRAERGELEDRLGIARNALLGVDRSERATDHRSGQGVLVDRGSGRVAQRATFAGELLHQRAVAQHAHAVRNRNDLLEMVRDEDDRASFVAQRTHAREEPRRILLAKHRGRLVEDEDARVAREALRDLDELRFGDRQQPRLARKFDLRAERRKEFACAAPLRGAVDRNAAERGGLASERDILRDIERGHEVEFLMHHRDARAQRVGRLLERDRGSTPRNDIVTPSSARTPGYSTVTWRASSEAAAREISPPPEAPRAPPFPAEVARESACTG